MIEAKSLCSRVPVLDNVDISLMPGHLTGIVGPNGAGKTTLLKMLAGLEVPDSGSIILNQQSISSYQSLERARNIAYLEQYSFVHWPLSVYQLVKLGRFPHRDQPENSPQQDQSIIERVITQVGIENLLDRTFNSLSGGERARVLLARALVVEADHLLVDEPIASLDLKYQLEIMGLLVKQAKNNSSVAVILHDLNLAAKYCDIIYLIDKGKVITHGLPTDVLSEETIKKTFDINARVVTNNQSMEIYPLNINQ